MPKLRKNRFLELALLLAAAVVCPAQVTFTEYPVPSAGSGPETITAGPDGNLWFTEQDNLGNKVGRITTAGVITEFALPTTASAPHGITAGPDGNLWFTQYFAQKIGRITPAGVITEFPIPGGSFPFGITAGSDGNLWFVERFGNKVRRITTAGAFTGEFPIPTSGSEPFGITAGPDGNLWFTEGTGNKIGRITPTGVITEFPVPAGSSAPYWITAGPDGNLWFTGSSQIGRITPAGSITQFPVPTANSNPLYIAAGPDGNVWFTEADGNKIGRITPAGVITEFPVPTVASSPRGITTGPDGNLWFTERFGNKIVKANVPNTPPTIRPATGGNAGSVTVQITGSGFQSGAAVKLTGVGPDILGANTTIPSAFFLTTTFNLVGAAPGPRTVVITNPDASFLSLPGAFTVEQGGAADIRISKAATPFVPGRRATVFVSVANAGNIDANQVQIVEALDPQLVRLVGMSTPGVNDLSTSAKSSTIFWEFPLLSPIDVRGVSYEVHVTGTAPVNQSVNVSTTGTGPNSFREFLECAAQSGATIAGCAECRLPCEAARLVCKPPTAPVPCAFAAGLCLLCLLNVDPSGPAGCLKDITDTVTCWCSLGDNICERLIQLIRGSVDPNALYGPVGVGPERWVPDAVPAPYIVSFENLPSATAPAQEVFITNPLDSLAFDLDTLSLGPVSFGDRVVVPPNGVDVFNTSVDLRPGKNLLVNIDARLNKVTGVLSITFRSIDPATGQLPTDPLSGFLPPNTTPPQGQGTILYTVKPKNGLATGTQIKNRASIVFDLNQPIVTPEWVNTIDNTKPSSHVLPLPPIQNSPTFTVQWQGTDVGSGVEDFTIYVSDGGGPFAPWLTRTTSSQGTYTGLAGHTYSFYSLARDLTGNLEPPKAVAEAATTLRDNTPPNLSFTLSPTVLWPPNHNLIQVNANVQVSDDFDPNPQVRLVSITSNEPDSGLDKEDIPNDVQGTSLGTDDRSFSLRAERSGAGNGRLYTVTYRATDASGNSRLATATVTVPHDQGNN